MASLDAGSSYPARLFGYLNERFPLVPYTLITAAFFASGALAARALGGGDTIYWQGALVVLLFFFHLRVFDEHKDYVGDQEAHPERLLSRGVVTLGELSFLQRVANAVSLAILLLTTVYTRTTLAWAAAFVFSALMRYEFGIGKWLRKRLVVYALTHNPVAALLAVFIWACTDADWSNSYLWYIGVVTFGTLAFEVGRKVKLPAEEVEGADTYSAAIGRNGAFVFLFLSYLGGWICLGGLAWVLGSWVLYLAAVPAVLGVALSLPLSKASAKRVELGSSVYLLLTFILAGVMSW